MTTRRTPTGESAPVSLQELQAEARALAGKYFPDRRRFAYRRYRALRCPTEARAWGGMQTGGVRHA